MPEIYYHITKEEYLDSILKEGLKPQLGDNSQFAYDNRPAVYLCQEKDLPYWQILLKNPVVLQVETEVKLEHFNYGKYAEYMSLEMIPAECIKLVNMPKPTDWHMRSLCIDYLHGLSRLTVNFAYYYDGRYAGKDEKAIAEDMRLSTLASLNILTDRMDFSVLTKEEIRKELKELGEDGEYTFCDTYNNTEIKLYEQLQYYPEDELSEARKKLYSFISDTFDGCLDIDTGGWIGRKAA